MYLPENTGSDFKSCPPGNHVAICYRVLDLGTQKTEYNGQTKIQHKVLVTWETPDEVMDDQRPFSLSKKYTFSSHEKSTFRKDLESWRGAAFKETDFGPGGFDIKNLLGKACMINVIEEKKDNRTYTNIASIARLPKGMPIPVQANPSVFFTLEDPDWEVYRNLSDGLKAQIASSPEYMEATNPGRSEPFDPSSESEPVPF